MEDGPPATGYATQVAHQGRPVPAAVGAHVGRQQAQYQVAATLYMNSAELRQ